MNNLPPIHVLFIDDETDVRIALKGAAALKNVILRDFSSLEEGLTELKINPKIKFVILDAKGYINQSQVKGTESDSFALAAHRRIEELAREENRYLPYCFYTGHSDLKTTWTDSGEFKVFDKTEDNVVDLLFGHIWNSYLNSEEGMFRIQYSDLFQAIDLIGDVHITSDLIALLRGLINPDYGSIQAERTSICNTVRRIQEAIYKSLNAKNSAVVKNSHFHPNTMIKFNDVKKHLSGNQVGHMPTTTQFQNSLMEDISQTIYWGCGKYLHFNRNETYFPSRYGLRALILGVFEQLIWFKDIYTRI